MEKEIVATSSEITRDVPIGLKYFRSVDTLTSGSLPDRNYFNILVYAPGEDQPRAKILRIQVSYSDENTGKQDEIELAGKGYRLQFNAECDPEGDYVKYPSTISEEATAYLNETVACFMELLKMNGSKVVINHKLALVSDGGMWKEARPTRNVSPRLEEPQKQLPE
jgi:hypothetical protein